MPRADGTPTIAEIIFEPDDHVSGCTPYTCVCPPDAWGRKKGQTAHYGHDWPSEEDCPRCDAHRGGPHRLSCAAGGAYRAQFDVEQTPDGRLVVCLPGKPTG